MESNAQALADSQWPTNGGWGHKAYPEIVARGGGGYGPMAITSGLAMVALALFEASGVEIPNDCLEKVHKGFIQTADDRGIVGYGLAKIDGTGGKLKKEPGRPYKTSNRSPGRHLGRPGSAAVAHMIASSSRESWTYLGRHMANGCANSHKHLLDGHSSATLGTLWGTLGAAHADGNAFREYMDHIKWWFILSETHDGAFVNMPGRDQAKTDYSHSPRGLTTGAGALILALKNRRLRITGYQGGEPVESDPAVRPERRRFTSADGTKSFLGTLVAYYPESGKVRVRKSGGSSLVFKMEMLSAADREYVKKMAPKLNR